MPGGIGNTGFECGGITSPLVLMGTHFGLRKDDLSLPVIFDKGHALCQNFIACHHTLQCREIRGKDRFPRHCILPVLRSPELFMDAHNGDHREPVPPARRAGYSKLYSHLQAITHRDFSDLTGVNNYIEGDGITKCKQSAEKVAVKVQAMIST